MYTTRMTTGCVSFIKNIFIHEFLSVIRIYFKIIRRLTPQWYSKEIPVHHVHSNCILHEHFQYLHMLRISCMKGVD